MVTARKLKRDWFCAWKHWLPDGRGQIVVITGPDGDQKEFCALISTIESDFSLQRSGYDCDESLTIELCYDAQTNEIVGNKAGTVRCPPLEKLDMVTVKSKSGDKEYQVTGSPDYPGDVVCCYELRECR